MNQITEQIAGILGLVVGVAIIAVLVSRNANTAGVLQAGGSAFSSILGTAISPVTGNNPVTPMGNFGMSGMNGYAF